jgi:preprotein translocase subunit SecF
VTLIVVVFPTIFVAAALLAWYSLRRQPAAV